MNKVYVLLRLDDLSDEQILGIYDDRVLAERERKAYIDDWYDQHPDTSEFPPLTNILTYHINTRNKRNWYG